MVEHRKLIIVFMLTAMVLLLTIPSVAPTTATEDLNLDTQFTLFSRQQFISIQPTLYNYYSNLTTRITRNSDYSEFITPQAVKPIADSILEVTRDMPYSDEQFANAVLALVHQIPYKITGAKYPVETLVENSGDCGALSLLAASIMKAGGLDVVLIRYTGIDPGHMNVGVYLSHKPNYNSILLGATSYEYNNKTYWAAEATPQADWKVGDQSHLMANAIVNIISIDSCKETSPGQVFSGVSKAPVASSITVNIKPQQSSTQDQKRALVITGSIQPFAPNNSVTLYINKPNSTINYVTTQTDNSSSFAYDWNITKDGTYYITAHWSGDTNKTGADSETLVVLIGPQALIQFQTDTYNYVVGTPIGDFAVRPYIGIEDFLTIPLETNARLSYNFIILQTGTTPTEIPTQEITIPASEYTRKTGPNETETIQVPAKTRLVPTKIPSGTLPLRLSNDFNQTINNNLCLIVQKDKNSTYNLNVKGLNDGDVSNILENNQNSTVFLNATQGIEESTWYKVTTAISNESITANLRNENGTTISTLTTTQQEESDKQLVLLLAKNENVAIVMKDLKIQPIADTPEAPNNTSPTPQKQGTSLIEFYIIGIIAIITTIATMAYIQRKRRIKTSVNT